MATLSSILAWKNAMDRGDWWATVHEVAKSCRWLSTHTLKGEACKLQIGCLQRGPCRWGSPQLPGTFSPGGPGVPVSMNNPDEQLLWLHAEQMAFRNDVGLLHPWIISHPLNHLSIRRKHVQRQLPSIQNKGYFFISPTFGPYIVFDLDMEIINLNRFPSHIS